MTDPAAEAAVHRLDPRSARARSHLRVIRLAVNSDRGLARILGVSASQVSRWRGGQRPDRDNADRLAGLALVVEMLLRWLEPEIVEEWLTGANAHLDGATPAYHIHIGQLAEVVGAIEAMKAGVFA